MSSAKAPIDLVAEARAIPRKPNGEPCSVVMATRNRPDLAASIVALVHDSTVSAATAATVLSRHGAPGNPRRPHRPIRRSARRARPVDRMVRAQRHPTGPP